MNEEKLVSIVEHLQKYIIATRHEWHDDNCPSRGDKTKPCTCGSEDEKHADDCFSIVDKNELCTCGSEYVAAYVWNELNIIKGSQDDLENCE